jgi:hypothetical protein
MGCTPYFYTASSNTSPVGLTFSLADGTGTLTFEDATTGGSDDNTEAVSAISIEVSDAWDTCVNGTYTNIEEGATGKMAKYFWSDSDYMIKHDGTKWMIEYVGGRIIYYATADADNPWEVPTGSWYATEFSSNDSYIKFTPNY